MWASNHEVNRDKGNESMNNSQLMNRDKSPTDLACNQKNIWNGMYSNFVLWNQPNLNELSVHSKNFVQRQNNEEYNISLSLKDIWSNFEPETCTTFSNVESAVTQMERLQIPLMEPINVAVDSPAIVKPNVIDGGEWSTHFTVRPPITSLNGQTKSEVENLINFSSPSNNVDSLLFPHQAQYVDDNFKQRLQVIVNNGFLDPKILSEPISADTYELVQMLIFFVMEYSKTKNYVKSENPNPALFADINHTFYKINLIQHEIAKCQSKFLEMRQRIQRQLRQSLAENNNMEKLQMINRQHNIRYSEVPVQYDFYNQYANYTNDTETIQSKQSYNQAFSYGSQLRAPRPQINQQCSQNQNPVQRTIRKVQFLPKTMNCENRLNFNEETNNDKFQRDSHSIREGSPN